MNGEKKMHDNLVTHRRAYGAEMHFQKMHQKRTLETDTLK
jgi:hypothetical protein